MSGIVAVDPAKRRTVSSYEDIPTKALAALRKPLSWQRVLGLGLGIAHGLAAAHRRGVLHRDIKPGNVAPERE